MSPPNRANRWSLAVFCMASRSEVSHPRTCGPDGLRRILYIQRISSLRLARPRCQSPWWEHQDRAGRPGELLLAEQVVVPGDVVLVDAPEMRAGDEAGATGAGCHVVREVEELDVERRCSDR
ncbi:MAG: hypothetical protein R2705_22085 [Ilumatobacteraceae bacterium]